MIFVSLKDDTCRAYTFGRYISYRPTTETLSDDSYIYGLQTIHLSCGSDIFRLQRYLQMVDIGLPVQLVETLHTANSFSCIMTNRPTFSEGRYLHELQRPFHMAWTFIQVRYIYELKISLHMACMAYNVRYLFILEIPLNIRVADTFSYAMHHFLCQIHLRVADIFPYAMHIYI